MAATLDFRNTNTLWASVLVETLVRCGVRTAVVSPGSRSAPLTVACARHPGLDAVPVLDERSAAFFALGLAKRTRRPVVLVCTSGTAGANHLPAVIEARESGTPLLVVTADRPPELRACSSGQTIDQQKLFGDFVAFFHELAPPEAGEPMLRYLRQTVAHACERTRAPDPGPVHLNAPFRDPLAPVADGSASGLEGVIDETFFTHLAAEPVVAVPGVRLRQRPTTARGIVVAGPAPGADPATHAAALRAIAGALRWPILADALSPLRHAGACEVPVVACYDALLRDESVARALTPRSVLCVGGWPTSKVLRGWLERSGAEILLVGEAGANRDALHGRTRRIRAPIESLAIEGPAIRDDAWLAQWAAADGAARASLDEGLRAEPGFFEGLVPGVLAAVLPAGTPVFVASSMPVRDVEYFWPLNDRGFAVHFNRGANGIDGTLSTALGVAHGADRPAVLLTGDLAFLHDANGLLSAPRLRGGLTVVLINNDGGGIFEHLPIAAFEPPFEAFFATPQRVDFAKLCAAHEVAHRLVAAPAELAAELASPCARGIRVLEIRTDRKRDAATRRRLFANAARAAAGAIGGP